MKQEEESVADAFVEPDASDNAVDMPISAARPNWEQHPLLVDRARLEAITELMWFQIQKTMFPGTPRRSIRSPGGTELTVVGGVSAEDVLREALADLLRYESSETVGWEGLGVTIARRRAVDAIRTARKHRGLPDGTEIVITSLDNESDDGRQIAERIPDSGQLTDEQVVEDVLRVDRLRAVGVMAQKMLSQRDRDILFRITRGEALVAIAPEAGLTPQRVGQIYASSVRKINAALRLDPKFQRLYDLEGGTSNE